jgi:hypothetical protein
MKDQVQERRMGSSSRVQRVSPTGTHPVVGPTTGCAFRLEGEYWTIAYEGAVLRLRDAKGLRYLAYLLARPGERLAATDLIAATAPAQGEVSANPERARLAVTKRVKAAITRIGEHHRALGYHLATSIKTGHQCAYLPAPQRLMSWRTTTDATEQ